MPQSPKTSAPPAVERKNLDLEIKAMSGDDADPGTATLYVAVFGNKDRADEVILPGAFNNLDVFTKDGFYTVSHNWGMLPVGTVTSAKQDDHGLLIDIAFHSTDDAQSCRKVMRERMERGKSVKSSIGYVVTEDEETTENGVTTRLLKGIELYEASYVPVPCNPATEAVAIKGLTTKVDVMAAAVESKYYDDYSYGYYGYDDDANHNAATAAVCALLSGLMRSIANSLRDEDTPKAERLATLVKAFADTAATSIKLLDVLMDDEDGATAAAKTFGDLRLATKGVLARAKAGAIETKGGKPQAMRGVATPASGKSGRVLSSATLETMSGHLDTLEAHAASMGESHKGMGEACKALRDYLDTYINVPPAGKGASEGDTNIDMESPADEKGADAAPNSLAERSERLVSDLDGVLKALKRQHGTRAAEGRSLPPAKWDALKGLADAATALLAERPDPVAAKDAAAADAATLSSPDWGDIYRQYNQSVDLIDATLIGS